MRRVLATAAVSVAVLCTLAPAHALAQPVWAVAGGTLVSFDSSTPGTLTATSPITGLQPAEIIFGIDFRPATGQLYGIGSTSRVYTIDLGTGAATQVGATQFTPVLSGTSFGVDFDPVADRIRVVSDADQNLSIDPATGTATLHAALAYALGDPSGGPNPEVTAVAYRDSGGGNERTLFGIDAEPAGFARFVRIGDESADDSTQVDAGVLTTIGDDLPETGPAVGFDISPNGVPLAVLSPPAGGSVLFELNLADGFPFEIGPVGAAITGGMALEPVPPTFVVTPSSVSFGSQPVGTLGPPQTVTIRNVGDRQDVSSVFIGGAHPDDVFLMSTNCGGPQPNLEFAECEARLRFAPSAVGQRSAVLTLGGPACCPPPSVVDVPLAGEGTPGPAGPQGPQGPAGPQGLAGPPGAVVFDDTPPSFRVQGLVTRVSRRAFLRRGVRLTLTPSEPVSFELQLLGALRGARIARPGDVILAEATLPQSRATRPVRLRIPRSVQRRLARRVGVRLRIVATDAAGNQATATRRIAVR